MERQPLIETKSLSKHYQTIKAVDDLSINVLKGDVYGFLGPNGAGKSTTIRMILSLVRPTSGEIFLFGKQLTMRHKGLLGRVGALVEKPDFYSYLNAAKNLEILGKLTHTKNLNGKIEEVLELVGLSDRKFSKVKTFSQGMKQRLGIAQALLHDPELIILDEPINGLDPQGQKEIRNLIKNVNANKGITFVISSHILTEVEQVANRMVIINKGKAVVEGDVNELLLSYGMNVSFVVSNMYDAEKLINKSAWKEKMILFDGNKMHFRISKEEIPVLTNYFVENNFDIYTVDPLRSLEDYFISITENE